MESMIGGKIIGQGTYGCVFQPALLCKKKVLTGSIGKITDADDLERELHAGKILGKIVNYKYYFILPEDTCVPRIIDNQEEKDINKCKFLQKNPVNNLKQYSMPYGGIDLNKATNIYFFTLMKHMLEIGSLMLLSKFVHYDIHNGNIVVDKNGVPRLIDFGQSFSYDEISLETIGDRWKVLTPTYSAEPPEVTFLTAIDDYNQYSFEDAILEVMPQKKILKTVEKLLGIPVKKQIVNLGNFFKSSQAFRQNNLVKFWKLYYPGFDSWGIGVLLLEMLERFMYSYEFIESSEWKLKKFIVVKILTQMLDTNPKHRIDCIEALSMFDPMNDIYLQYGTEWVDARRKQRSGFKV
jgi:serine/threonine protein kinase